MDSFGLYTVITFFAFLGLAIIWNKDTMANFFIKMFWIGMVIYSAMTIYKLEQNNDTDLIIRKTIREAVREEVGKLTTIDLTTQ